MPVPPYLRFIDPVLRYLAQHPDGVPARDAHDAAAAALGLPPADRAEVLPSGGQAVYKNRAGWAHDRLKRAGYSSSPKRGVWQLTPAGIAFALAHPNPLTDDEVDEIGSGTIGIGLASKLGHRPAGVPPEPPTTIQSPDDQLEQALAEIRRSVAAEILEILAQIPPQTFESLVLDLLHKMGYGTSRDDLQRVGGAGDGGIDGVIALDRLGLEKVYIQAKRWQGVVSRPEVQGFYGALAGQQANKGVFITTSTFTQHAVEFAKSVQRIVLVDGQRLAGLMMDFEVGVASRPVRVPRIDTDYFEA